MTVSLLGCSQINERIDNVSSRVDANFKSYLLDNFDTDSDGEISEDEALAVKEIDIAASRLTIRSLSGIEYFKNLEKLDCSYNSLTSLDLSGLTKLRELNASGLSISELDLTAITQLKTLDVTDNASLTRVICPSQEWLYGVFAYNDLSLSYIDTAEHVIYWGSSIEIDGVVWAGYNVGSHSGDFYGNTYTFDDAQKVCPTGWRTPTVTEFWSLCKNYSSEVKVNGMLGRWFSGSKAYSESVPAIFLPYLKGGSSDGCYWSSMPDNKFDISGAYYLRFYSSNVGVNYNDRSCTFSVRCVKN